MLPTEANSRWPFAIMRFRWGSRFVRLGHGAGLTIAGDAETRVEEGRTQPPWCSGNDNLFASFSGLGYDEP